MAYNPCTPCACVPSNIDSYAFHQAAIIVLCSILTELQEATGTDVDLVAVGGDSIALGQAAMAASIPVAIASNQTWTGATNLGKAEDAGHVSDDVGVMALGVRNEDSAILSGTQLDYTPFATSRIGDVYVNYSLSRSFEPTNRQMMQVEDAASANGYAGWAVLVTREDTPTVTTDTSGDFQFPKTNDVGALYSEPSNKVATWAAATIAGAAGGITTGGANALTNSAKVKRVELLNTTDQIVQLSLDAGTTWVLTAPATNGVANLDLGANGRWAASNIHIRSIGSNTSSGSAYISVMI